MKTKFFIFLVIGMLFSVQAVFAQEQAGEGATKIKKEDLKTQVVRIRGYEGVTPLNLFIEPGTVVMWLNQYSGQIKITFPDKKVTMACKGPTNFFVNDQGQFESRDIDFGSVASLCFIQRGTFEYFIERTPENVKRTRSDRFRFEGKIVVK